MLARGIIALSVIGLSGCASIDLPELDMLDRAFRDTEVDLEDFPSIKDAPVAPTDIRLTQEWDAEAKAIITERDQFDPPAPVDPTLQERTVEDIEALKARVRAYKVDDPS